MGLYKKSGGWASVAEHVGGGITAQQCRNRWHKYLKYMQQEGIKQGDWSGRIRRYDDAVLFDHCAITCNLKSIQYYFYFSLVAVTGGAGASACDATLVND